MTFKPTALDDLDHDIRNATLALSKHVKEIPSQASRLLAKKELHRINTALIKYEGRLKMRSPLTPKHKFSRKSKDILNTCHEDLQAVFFQVVRQFDCTIIGGHRGKKEQNALCDAGKSKLRWPKSKHNTDPSGGVDVAPYPINWQDLNRFRFFAGYVVGMAHSMGIVLRWGGDWDSDTELSDNRFNDLCHYEIVNP